VETVDAVVSLQNGQQKAEEEPQIAEQPITDVGALFFHPAEIARAEAGSGPDGDSRSYLRIVNDDELGIDILIRDLRQLVDVGQQRLHFGRLEKTLVPDQLPVVGNDADGGIETLDGPFEKFSIHGFFLISFKMRDRCATWKSDLVFAHWRFFRRFVSVWRSLRSGAPVSPPIPGPHLR